MDKNNNKLLSLLIISAYFLFDGLGMFISTYKFIGGDKVYEENGLLNLHERADSSYIVKEMITLQISRVINLAVFLFPILFITLKYRISFKVNSGMGVCRYIPYIRGFLGALSFYYILTLGTKFSHEVFTNYYSFGSWRFLFRIVASFAVCSAFFVQWQKLIKGIRSFPVVHTNWLKILFIVCISICSCMLLEFQAASKMNMDSNMIFFNVIYWTILQVFIDVITRNIKVGAFISLGISYLIGLVNDIVFQFRGNYIMFGDLTVVRTALEVAGNYKYRFGFWFWISIAILVVSSLIVICIKFPKYKKPCLKEILMRFVISAIMVVSVVCLFNSGLLYNRVFGVGWDYNTNILHVGYMPYFLSNMNSISKVELEGYNAQLADNALDSAPVSGSSPYASPNIIIIQNEAFSDLSVMYDIETDKDYMPFIHNLSENTQKGYLNMSVTGGPTANTEFEILMRSTLQYFPYGSVPYTQYVDSDLPSVPQVLENQPIPYHTVAYHSYYSSGYRRVGVYDHFGFDESVFEDDFRNIYSGSDLVRDLMSDSADYRRVEQMYEDFRSTSDEPWFCFNVTIQNHGGYTQIFEPSDDDRICVTNFEATDSINEYLSLVKISDDAFRELIEYFSNCDEPTIIAMYGDHQPKFDFDAYSVLDDHSLGSDLNHYYVPYVIWANFDIEEVNTLGDAEHEPVLNTLSTNYFASTVLEIAGVEISDYDRYLLDLHESVPAITAIGIWDSEGNYYPSIDACPYSDELSALQMVQYNLIFDDDGRLTDRFV